MKKNIIKALIVTFLWGLMLLFREINGFELTVLLALAMIIIEIP